VGAVSVKQQLFKGLLSVPQLDIRGGTAKDWRESRPPKPEREGRGVEKKKDVKTPPKKGEQKKKFWAFEGVEGG